MIVIEAETDRLLPFSCINGTLSNTNSINLDLDFPVHPICDYMASEKESHGNDADDCVEVQQERTAIQVKPQIIKIKVQALNESNPDGFGVMPLNACGDTEKAQTFTRPEIIDLDEVEEIESIQHLNTRAQMADREDNIILAELVVNKRIHSKIKKIERTTHEIIDLDEDEAELVKPTQIVEAVKNVHAIIEKVNPPSEETELVQPFVDDESDLDSSDVDVSDTELEPELLPPTCAITKLWAHIEDSMKVKTVILEDSFLEVTSSRIAIKGTGKILDCGNDEVLKVMVCRS